MRAKTKILILLLAVIPSLFFTSCEKDLYEDAMYQDSKDFKVKKVNFKDIKSNRQAFRKIGESMIKKNPQMQYREVYNEEYGVFIDTTNILMLEKEGKHSFTFRITNQEVLNKFENLVLTSKDDGSYYAYIVEYLISPQEIIILNNGGTLNEKEPTAITKVENLARFSITGNGAACVDVLSYHVHMCRDKNGREMVDNGELGNGCVGMPYEVEYFIVTIDAGCLSNGGGNTSNPDSGTPSDGSSGSTGNGSSTSTGSTSSGNTGNTNPTNPPTTTNPPQTTDNGNHILTTPIIEIEGITLFINGLSQQQQDWWNLDATPEVKQEIKNYFHQNNGSTEAQEFVEQAINDFIDGENCVVLPEVFNLSEVEAPFNPNLFGDYTESTTQQDHEDIKQQFNILRSTEGNLAAVNYLINTYSMNDFGPNTINFNYTISFLNGLAIEAHANAIIGYNSSGVMTSCNIEIDINLLSYADFGYITRVIKHELYHVLQGEFYGQNGLSNAAREFDAYYSQIFRFNNLKRIQDMSLTIGLAKFMINYMNQMSDSEKETRQDMIDKVKQTFKELCID